MNAVDGILMRTEAWKKISSVVKNRTGEEITYSDIRRPDILNLFNPATGAEGMTDDERLHRCEENTEVASSMMHLIDLRIVLKKEFRAGRLALKEEIDS